MWKFRDVERDTERERERGRGLSLCVVCLVPLCMGALQTDFQPSSVMPTGGTGMRPGRGLGLLSVRGRGLTAESLSHPWYSCAAVIMTPMPPTQ